MITTAAVQARSGPAIASELRLLLPEVVRRWRQEMAAEAGPEGTVPPGAPRHPSLEGLLPALLEQVAAAIESGHPPESGLPAIPLDTGWSSEQIEHYLDRSLQEYQALHDVVLELLEASAPLPREVRRLLSRLFHAAERRLARTGTVLQEQQRRDQERQLRALVESNILGVIEANLDGQILHANHAFLEMIGQPDADLSDGSFDWRSLTPPEYHELDQRCLEQVRSSGRCDLYEKEYVRPDGSRISVLVGRALTNAERGLCITYVVDRTHFKQLETALQEHAAELERANERLNQWLAMIAHELRTPLSTISNALYILESLSLSDRAARQVTVASRQTRHASRLVNDLMDLSRVTRGKIELRREAVSLRRLSADAVESVRPLMDSLGHQVTTNWCTEPLVVNADPIRIEQIINNLLTNAAKYTEPGGHVSLSLWREGDHGVLRIRDNGIGIDPAKLPRIFNLYEQFGLSETRSHGGLGIGLSLVRRLVELHGGAVEAWSEGIGKGSEFKVAFPLLSEGSAR